MKQKFAMILSYVFIFPCIGYAQQKPQPGPGQYLAKDKKTGETIVLDGDTALRRFYAGEVQLPRGQTIAVKQKGRVYDIDPFEQDSTFVQGILSGDISPNAAAPAEIAEGARKQEAVEKYDNLGGQALALGAGALSSATLGTSDLVAGALGYGGELSKIRQASPNAYLIGKVIGTIIFIGALCYLLYLFLFHKKKAH